MWARLSFLAALLAFVCTICSTHAFVQPLSSAVLPRSSSSSSTPSQRRSPAISSLPSASRPVADLTMQLGGSPVRRKLDKRSGNGGGVLDRPPPEKFDIGNTNRKKKDEAQGGGEQFKVILFNDNGNTREYVSRSLVEVCRLKEPKAFDVMTKAHLNGMAIVGVYPHDEAEEYADALKERGILAGIEPVDDGDDDGSSE